MRPDHNNAIDRVKPADGLWAAWSTAFFSTILQTEVTDRERAKVPHSENTGPPHTHTHTHTQKLMIPTQEYFYSRVRSIW